MSVVELENKCYTVYLLRAGMTKLGNEMLQTGNEVGYLIVGYPHIVGVRP